SFHDVKAVGFLEMSANLGQCGLSHVLGPGDQSPLPWGGENPARNRLGIGGQTYHDVRREFARFFEVGGVVGIEEEMHRCIEILAQEFRAHMMSNFMTES